MIDFDIKNLENINQKTQTKLYNEYYFLVYNICNKYLRDSEESKDLSQEVFIKVFNNIKKIKPINCAQLTNWIKVLTKNLSIDYLRDKNRLIEKLSNYGNDFIDKDELDVVSLFENTTDNLSKLISKSISELSPRSRIAVRLRFFENKTHEEISKELQIHIGTSKSNLYKAKLRLADLLKNYKNEI
jgi:RNA polymerase sigma factor (sigma-70 family)